jgi:predicted NAD-dependent protein-ADP-ribosyltransferase YbiA (DUF1768 family)
MEDKFVFYSKSADKPAGRGSNEEKNSDADYTELNKIKDWRKMLSNFYISPFIIDDMTWNSVEHFFHALKFRNNKKPGKEYEFYKTFALDSNSPWCEVPVLAKNAGKAGKIGTNGKIFDKTIGSIKIPKDIKMREDFYTSNIPSKLQKLGFLAKFTQNPELKHALLCTGEAELWHYSGRGASNILFKELMIVRDCIKKYDSVYDLSNISKFSTKNITKMIN